MKIKRKIKVISLAACVGAVTAYLFDPVAGPARRRRLVTAIERRSDDARDVVQNVERVKEAITLEEPASPADEASTATNGHRAAPSTPSGSNAADDSAEPEGEPAVAGVTDVGPESEAGS